MWEWLTNLFQSSGTASSATSGSAGISAAGNATSAANTASAANAANVAQPAAVQSAFPAQQATPAAQPIGGQSPQQPTAPMQPAAEGGSPDALSGITKMDQGAGYSPFGSPPAETSSATQPNVAEVPTDELENAAKDYTGIAILDAKAEPDAGLGNMSLQQGGVGQGQQPYAGLNTSSYEKYAAQQPQDNWLGSGGKLDRFQNTGRFSELAEPGSTTAKVAGGVEDWLDRLSKIPPASPSPEQGLQLYQPQSDQQPQGLVPRRPGQAPPQDDVQKRYQALMASLQRR